MLRLVCGSAITVDPMKKSKSTCSTPNKEFLIDQIIHKYVGMDRTTDTFTSSITTMFHNTFPEEKQLFVSPHKKLTERDCEKYLTTFQRISDRKSEFQESPHQDEEFHHLKTSSDYGSEHNSFQELAQNLEQVFDSPTNNVHTDKSPEFYNPETKLKSLPKELPIIEENEEIANTHLRLNGLITQIDQKIGFHQVNQQVIEKIKDKYLPKTDEQFEFQDFPEFNPSDQPKEEDLYNLKFEQTKLQSPKQIIVKDLRAQASRNITFNSNEFNDFISEQFQTEEQLKKNSTLEQPTQQEDQNVALQGKIQIKETQTSKFKFPGLNVPQIRRTIQAIIIILILTLLSQLFTLIL
ncbi:unnamed protein product (macronuclear) [Paramecium tetraurelia]|uniref:Uncharacterized protein n=1 Tax=Paramecium tetraurelia TaxID=5888 RepID=A0CU55_PARTE|nr:uncharacterized protein GSPATT00010521001 [Paramecium tetraurelia]CAK74322.1 unnamed protein product [Paramecium tetraurelia]|eukprot:XP_001441719.1 hypothetical protein (macronuclear) [Paramecium tetraurelia strain d4-2]